MSTGTKVRASWRSDVGTVYAIPEPYQACVRWSDGTRGQYYWAELRVTT